MIYKSINLVYRFILKFFLYEHREEVRVSCTDTNIYNKFIKLSSGKFNLLLSGYSITIYDNYFVFVKQSIFYPSSSWYYKVRIEYVSRKESRLMIHQVPRFSLKIFAILWLTIWAIVTSLFIMKLGYDIASIFFTNQPNYDLHIGVFIIFACIILIFFRGVMWISSFLDNTKQLKKYIISLCEPSKEI